MTVPFNHMTAARIRGRLAEIASAEQAHAARDFDAELGEVMRNGGDLDAMEAKQMEAERAARRLRVAAWELAQQQAAEITEGAYALSRQAGVKMADLGTFQSSKLCEVAREAQFVSNRFGSAEHQMQVGHSVQGRRLD
ncbi:hypothetical protein AB9E06_21455 [Rhizobium leguminosarum]|uniref:hypothetical protein n=1 Tax=Rhizobium leguminosarum TaxID=384 RepID=UPI003F979024